MGRHNYTFLQSLSQTYTFMPTFWKMTNLNTKGRKETYFLKHLCILTHLHIQWQQLGWAKIQAYRNIVLFDPWLYIGNLVHMILDCKDLYICFQHRIAKLDNLKELCNQLYINLLDRHDPRNNHCPIYKSVYIDLKWNKNSHKTSLKISQVYEWAKCFKL